MQYRPSGGLRKFVSTVTALATIVSPFATFVPVAHAANLFSEGFESGNFSAWSSSDSPKWEITPLFANTGARKAVVRGNTNAIPPANDVLRKNVPTTGYENIVLSYYYQANNLDSGDFAGVQWYDGSDWATVPGSAITTADNGGGWNQASFPLPPGADDNADFRFRFVANLSAADDVVRIDDVSLDGDLVPTTGTVIVNKTVVGGVSSVATFQLFVGDTLVESGASNEFEAGTYQFTESNGNAEEETYEASYGPGCPEGVITVVAGETTTCDVTNTLATPPAPLCSDGLDNDDDGLIDEADPGCESPDDNDETDAVVTYQCSDGLDNDQDELTDEADPGCESPEDDDETDEAPPTCGVGDLPPCEETPTPTPESPRGGGDGTPSRSTLIVKKVIVFGEDASVSFSDFSFTIDGKRTYQFEKDGSNELKLRSGAHTITEEPGPGFTTGYEGDCAPDGHIRMLNGETYTCIIVNTLGVGGFNPGSDIPAPTPSPSPTPTPAAGGSGGSAVGDGGIDEDDSEPAAGVDIEGNRDIPASPSDDTLDQAAIGNLGAWPWWIPWLILFLLILWWLARRRSQG